MQTIIALILAVAYNRIAILLLSITLAAGIILTAVGSYAETRTTFIIGFGLVITAGFIIGIAAIVSQQRQG